MPAYTAYQLTLSLPFPCRILPPADPGSIADIEVVEGPVPRYLDNPYTADTTWQAAPDRFLWRGGRKSGRFLVENGSRITVQRNQATDDELLAFHCLDSVLAAALQQRGLLVLHANAAIVSGEAIAVSGPSGSGKSTTIAALGLHGCTMLADDITALRLTPSDIVEVVPGISQLHLCDDAAQGLGKNLAGLPRHQWKRMKAAIPTPVAPEATPLRSLYLLGTHPDQDVYLDELQGSSKFAALLDCVYGPLLPPEQIRQFALFQAVATQVRIFHLYRPQSGWTVGKVTEAILNSEAQRT